MTLLRGTFRLLIVVILIGVSLITVSATPLAPQAPSFPPLPALPLPSVNGISNEPSSVDLNLPPLKAVLLVGPIDSDSGPGTTQEKQNMDLAALELGANGVEVHKFYTPNNDWEQIKAAAEGAHFLLYRGHGVYWSPMPSPVVGGFYLKDKFVSSYEIRNDLRLAPNAVVMLYGCFTAGSSSIDGGPINSQEAQRRVAQYSDPFVDLGAAGYYADWYGDAFQMFVRFLFQGMTLGEAYEAYFDFNSTTVERYLHPSDSQAAMWLDKDNWGYIKYNNAFVGLPDQTLVDLFGVKMTLTPGSITYLAEPSSPARSFAVNVGATGSAAFSWTASVSPAKVPWLTVQPSSGSSGKQMTVTITPSGMPVGTYESRIHVVADTSEIVDGQQDILLTLRVVSEVHASYLPALIAGAP